MRKQLTVTVSRNLVALFGLAMLCTTACKKTEAPLPDPAVEAAAAKSKLQTDAIGHSAQKVFVMWR